MGFFSGFLSFVVDCFAACLPLVDFFTEAFPLPLAIFCLRFAAVCRALAVVSFGSSLTTKSLVILPAKRRSFSPRGFVNSSNDSSVASVWRRSLA